MNRLTDSEKLMYEVMGAIADSKIPVIYKGAMVTKLILREHDFDDFARETQDIDASWAGAEPPPMEKLTEMLNAALASLSLTAVVKREYGDKISAGYKIIDSGGDVKLSIDIDMRASIDSRTYQFGNISFEGVTPYNVMADKTSVIASDKVFRRSKDLIDLYALAHCVTVKTGDIRGIWERENRVIGSFNAFINRKDELRHSYEKLRRVDMKPDFDMIYGYMSKFLAPFIEAKANTLIWNRKTGEWIGDEPKHKPQTLLDEAREAGRMAKARSKTSPQSHKKNDLDI